METTNKSGIYPFANRILVKPDQMEEKTKGGIVFAETTKERYGLAQCIGTVIGAGSTCYDDVLELYGKRLSVKDGDKVMFARYAGAEVTGIDKEKYRIIYDKDITAIVTQDMKMEIEL